MNKYIVLTLLGASSMVAFSQGAMNFGNNLGASTFRAPIFSPSFNPVVGQGTGTSFFPQGATSYAGLSLLSGTGFTLALFGGPASVVDPSALTLITQTTFRTGGASGFINTTTVTFPGVQPGTQAKFQIRVWDNKGGTVTSWAQAIPSSPSYATSPMVTTGPLGGTDSNGNLFPTNPDSTGWTAFSLPILPEPSTYALAGLGAASLFLFRRRK